MGITDRLRASSRRLVFFFALVVAVVLGVSPSRAAPDDELGPGPSLDLRDVAPHEIWVDGAGTGSLWIALEASLARRDSGKNDFAAMMLLGVPLERLGSPRQKPDARRLHLRIAEGGKLRPLALSPPSADAPPSPAPEGASAPAEAPDAPPPRPVIVTPEMARAAVAAALEHAGLAEKAARIDRVVARARTSSLLPELRLRVTRLVDESQSLAPTEYDPGRITASGGSSLWLEARATWRLDRLVFADEEVALERLREERAATRDKLVDRVLDLLFALQRAKTAEEDPARTPEEQARAGLEAAEAAASLDVVTGGWLSRWRALARR
ncbi:hypothetical protein [Polyangium aurulentum]|uniref:hypothetical protein n=1 Tax=Polyangium aurulentum TaxID=2567896 RepID=UPI0010AEDE1D|nr:hypothetical protein [Polyangium aurulentum]UQA59631.1 hypothetical protein E8A73_003750 [Polyangium aurulentum]